MKQFLVILFIVSLSFYAIADDTGVLLDVYINGQRVKMIFDTGAEAAVLMGKTAQRLNLTIHDPPDNGPVEAGKVKVGKTEKCQIQFDKNGPEIEGFFGVIDIPEFINTEIEGILSWVDFKEMIMEIDSSSRRVRMHDTFAFEKSEWKCLDIKKDMRVLVVKTASEDPLQDYFLIDTGLPGGLMLRKDLWEKTFGNDSSQNTTLSAIYTPGVGLVVKKVKWIRSINLGGLELHEIPIQSGMEGIPWLTKEGVDGILGMWGLSCYQWIIDGPAGKIYFRPNDLIRIPEMYVYNRLGAVFVPKDIQTGNALIAHVVENGPAWRAGIRDGDELLKIDQVDATKWRIDPSIMPLAQYWEKPAGTEMNLTLLRGGKEVKIKMMLEEIFKDTGDHI